MTIEAAYESTLVRGSVFRPGVISTVGPESLGVHLAALASAAAASAAWQTANAAIYVPFIANEAGTITQLWAYNGAAAAGNVDVGVYRADDNVKVVSAGSTAMSGTNALQLFNVTDTYLPPGRYYLALAADGTTAEFFQTTISVSLGRVFGMGRETSAFALPATATPATMATHDKVPVIGLTYRSFV